MTPEQLSAEILACVKTVDERKTLSCYRAHVLAEDCGVSLNEIGDFCNAQGIKIINCQLGCFGDCSKLSS